MKSLVLYLALLGTCACYTCALAFVEVPWNTSVKTTEQRISIQLLPTAPSISAGSQVEEIPEEVSAPQPDEQTIEPEPAPEAEEFQELTVPTEKPLPQERPVSPLPDASTLQEEFLELLRERSLENPPRSPTAVQVPPEETSSEEIVGKIPEPEARQERELPRIEWKTTEDTVQEEESPDEPEPVEQPTQAPVAPQQESQAATTVEQVQTTVTRYIDVESTTVAPQFPLDQLRKRIVYPPAARRQGKAGTVLLELWISAEGTIDRIYVVDDPGFGMARAAVDAFEGLACTPAILNENNTAVRMYYPIRFALQ